jgi:hypothetical protein
MAAAETGVALSIEAFDEFIGILHGLGELTAKDSAAGGMEAVAEDGLRHF